jgi:hypothetical protein
VAYSRAARANSGNGLGGDARQPEIGLDLDPLFPDEYRRSITAYMTFWL